MEGGRGVGREGGKEGSKGRKVRQGSIHVSWITPFALSRTLRHRAEQHDEVLTHLRERSTANGEDPDGFAHSPRKCELELVHGLRPVRERLPRPRLAADCGGDRLSLCGRWEGYGRGMGWHERESQ